MKRVRKRYGKNNVISYRTVLDKKYRTVISYRTFTLKNTIPYRNSVPYRTVLPSLATVVSEWDSAGAGRQCGVSGGGVGVLGARVAVRYGMVRNYGTVWYFLR